MNKTLMGAVSTLAMLSMALPALAAGPRPDRADVVTGAPDEYTYNASWTSDVTQDGGKKSGSIALGDGSDDSSTSFAYYAFTGWWDQELSDVTKIRASFLASSTAVNSGGSPRISLEVGLNGEPYVVDGVPVVIFLDPAHCGDTVEGGWVYSDFTGDLTDCTIYDNQGHSYTSDGVTSAWDMLVADPFYAGTTVWFAYLIQDASEGVNYVDRIMLDSAFLTKAP
jgi:hypothetical protein